MAYGRALGSLAYQRNFHDWMKMFLQEAFPELEIHPKFPSEEMYFLTMDACPQYIDGIEIRQNKILENIVGECDENWAKSKKIKYIKSRIREVFHLENKKYPRWLQDPEWPIANGKPMKFIRTTVKARNEWHQHHFIDPDTQEERVIDDMS